MSRTPSPQRQVEVDWVEVDHQESMVSSEDVLFGVASVLEHFIARSEKAGRIQPTAFDGPLVTPGQGVHAFLDHIMNCGLCSKECFIMSLVYGERILQKHPDFTISRNNVHRFVLISVLVGSKILDDFYCRNMYYAMAGGLCKADLNALELKLCDLLDFELNVQPEEFTLYRDSLIRRSECAAAQQHQQHRSMAADQGIPSSPQPTQQATGGGAHLQQPTGVEVMQLGGFGNAQQYVDVHVMPAQHQHQQMAPPPPQLYPQQHPIQQQQFLPPWTAVMPVAPTLMAPPAAMAVHLGPMRSGPVAVPIPLMVQGPGIPPAQLTRAPLQAFVDPWRDAALVNRGGGFNAAPVVQHPALACSYDPLGAWGAWSTTTSGAQHSQIVGLVPVAPYHPGGGSSAMWAPQLAGPV